MPPEWLRPNAGLSSDEDLRRLQLRWLTDDLWMRRLVLAVAILLPSAGLVAVILSPSVLSAVGAGAGSLVALPLAYFFGREGPNGGDDQPARVDVS